MCSITDEVGAVHVRGSHTRTHACRHTLRCPPCVVEILQALERALCPHFSSKLGQLGLGEHQLGCVALRICCLLGQCPQLLCVCARARAQV